MKQVGIPLILTFKLDGESQARLDSWRQTYFPKARHALKAHLTIYHQLPGQSLREIGETLESFVSTQAPLPLSFDSLIMRAGFIAVAIESAELLEARSRLSLILETTLRAQDRQSYRPHVTITNLGSPQAARKCLEELTRQFQPWQGQALGLELFHYRRGPWELARYVPFPHP